MKKWMAVWLIFLGFSNSYAQDIPVWKITDVKHYIETHKGEVLVINFWATFCKPCVAEIPHFISVTDQYASRGVKLLLVSLDLPSYYPARIASFAKKHHFNSPIVWLDETNADYFCPAIDKGWSGSIPATLIIHTSSGYRKFFEEELNENKFESELKLALGE